MNEQDFMREAIRLAEEGMQAGRGGPFGCVVVRNGEVVGRGNSSRLLLTTSDRPVRIEPPGANLPQGSPNVTWAMAPEGVKLHRDLPHQGP